MTAPKQSDTILIVTGGQTDESVLRTVLKMYASAYVIGVDHGLDTLMHCGITPDLAVGDFDSASEETRKRYKDWEHTVLLQPMKDFTDTHIAVEHAIRMHPKQIIFVGATGTRLDHVQGNLALLALCLTNGVDAVLYDSHNRIRMTDGCLVLHKKEQYGNYVSLIPYTDTVSGITLTGFLYNLESATMTKEETIGISNEMREEECHITVEKGYLMVMETRD